MKEAKYYSKKGTDVICMLCPHSCVIPPGASGLCKARKNVDGILYSLVYGRPSSFQIDPIEKKPLYHFLPGSHTLSFGTLGCNLTCKHCQNWEISTAAPQQGEPQVGAPDVVDAALKKSCTSISFTYNEPIISMEFVLAVCREASLKGLKTVIVSNGYVNPEPLKDLIPFLDAANIDLKSFDDQFYQDICGAHLQPVLETIKSLKEGGVHLEITNLLIPTKNDDMDMIKEMAGWIATNVGRSIPLHLSAFHPSHKLLNISPTSSTLIKQAREIALGSGLRYVYAGNIKSKEGGNTYCPSCNKLIIIRKGFKVGETHLKEGACSCGQEIYGVFQS